MLALTQPAYGIENLQLDEVPSPEPDENQVLVDVEAVALNPADWLIASGKPAMLKLTEGLTRPNNLVAGTDFVGTVTQLGSDVSAWAVGDQVFGKANGALARHAVVDAKRIAATPNNTLSDEFAGLPIAGVTALQAVEAGEVKGAKVAVVGASGGVGHYCIQLAKFYGSSEVVAVCNGNKAQGVIELGADRIIDYTKSDFTNETYDVIIDCAGQKTSSQISGALNKDGRWISVGFKDTERRAIGPIPTIIKANFAFSYKKQKYVLIRANETSENLTKLANITEGRHLRTVIDRSFELADGLEAFAYLKQSKGIGKVLVKPPKS